MPQYRKLYLKTTESLDINEMPDDGSPACCGPCSR